MRKIIIKLFIQINNIENNKHLHFFFHLKFETPLNSGIFVQQTIISNNGLRRKKQMKIDIEFVSFYYFYYHFNLRGDTWYCSIINYAINFSQNWLQLSWNNLIKLSVALDWIGWHWFGGINHGNIAPKINFCVIFCYGKRRISFDRCRCKSWTEFPPRQIKCVPKHFFNIYLERSHHRNYFLHNWCFWIFVNWM